ncbi:MAG: FecR family protein [Agriterribacter sp.]
MSGNNGARYLQQLAKKVLAGKASEEEKLFLEEYYNAFDKHAGIDADVPAEELNRLQDTILQKIYAQTADHDLQRHPPKYFIWRRAAAAAVLLLVAATTVWIFSNRKNNATIAQAVIAQPADILPGGNKATLTLNNGSTIVLDDAKEGALVQQDHIQVSKTKEGQLIYTVSKQASATAAIQYNTVATPRGGQYQVVLPDGTKAWLNAASSIHFPTSFAQSKRAVSITGEVYFEVAHNTKQPFVVTAGNTSIQVLGTHFNVMAYDNEPFIKTTLAEGSVKISNADRTTVLRPGEQLQAGVQDFKVVKGVDVDAELAWKNGLFYFKDAGVDAVMKQVERWYDISVRYEGKMPEKQFNGKVPRNVSLSELMEILSFYDDMKCEIQGNTVTIKR